MEQELPSKEEDYCCLEDDFCSCEPRGVPLFFADFTASWLSFIASVSIAHPIDTLRVRWQTLGQTPVHTLRADGLRSLYSGIGAPMVSLGPIIATIFAVNEKVRVAVRHTGQLRRDDAGPLSPLHVLPRSNVSSAEAFVAGLAAGTAATGVMTPVSVIRVQQQNSSRGGHRGLKVRDVVSTLVRYEGMAGLYRANSLEVVTNGLGRGLYFAAYEFLKQHVSRTPLGSTWVGDSAAAFTTSVIWLLSLFPLEVVKTKLQADRIGVPLCDRRYMGSTVECVRQTLREYGVRGFYAGFSLTLVRTLASSGTALPLYDALKPKLRGFAVPADGCTIAA